MLKNALNECSSSVPKNKPTIDLITVVQGKHSVILMYEQSDGYTWTNVHDINEVRAIYEALQKFFDNKGA